MDMAVITRPYTVCIEIDVTNATELERAAEDWLVREAGRTVKDARREARLMGIEGCLRLLVDPGASVRGVKVYSTYIWRDL